MLESISFKNYKCLSDKSFDLKPLNIFSGYNGRGKSSVMQAILMLAQSFKQNSLEKLHVNGMFVKLGDFDELLYEPNESLMMEFSMNISDPEMKLHPVNLGFEMTDDYKVGKVVKCEIDGDDYYSSQSMLRGQNEDKGGKTLQALPSLVYDLFEPRNIHYVSANRMGPVSFVERKETPEYHSVGANGDMTINTLYTFKGEIDKRMNVDANDEKGHTLKESAGQWIDYIMNGERGAVAVDDGTEEEKKKRSSVLSLDFVLNERSYHSYNVGFGYSYILSIVVTALIAKSGNIVIVENPEAHLHPEAQFRLTQLLVKLASRGVQVFIETHSEHVVNAVRIAIIEREVPIRNDQVGLFFFDNDYTKKDLYIEKNGRINNWPSHFFDQYQWELAKILQDGAVIES